MLDEFHELLFIRRCRPQGGSWKFREHDPKAEVDLLSHIRILGIGLELARNGGSCGGISLKRD